MKIAYIGLTVWIYGLGMLASVMSDHHRETRMALTRFYESELNKCIITRIDTLKYPGRGNYRIFYTNCSSESLPIFLDEKSLYYIFTTESKISKKANTVDIEISENEKVVNLKIRHPATEDDRFTTMKIMGGVIGVVSLIILLLPNTYYDRVLKELTKR